ncbi:hypothetical protein [Aliidiomarina sanyensis]|uniref:hypothetical protein n=1 Tax=Aliidiomarina sanyensis TaxID=1249555 RepID=UPI000F88C9A4|nr:hypothetical protein [Aliidiomarina sanyensis]
MKVRHGPGSWWVRGTFSLWMIALLGGCMVTETVERDPRPNVIQRVDATQSQPARSTRSTAPKLSELTYQNAQFHLVVNQTTIRDVEHWWGRAHGRGQSGDLVFLNYTDRHHQGNQSRMVMMTLYFSTYGVLQDYDLQIHEFNQ